MTKLEEFNRRYKANEAAFLQLFRRHRIKATGIEGVKEGFARFGQPFLTRAIDILNNNGTTKGPFSALEDPTVEPEAYVDDIPFDTTAVAAQYKENKFLNFLTGLLNVGNMAAETISNVKNSISGTGTTPPETTEPAPPKINYLAIGAVIAIAFLLILLLRPKK